MNPKVYFATMLLTNPQKAKRILAALDFENYLLEMFEEEYADILNGTFISKQDEYIDRFVDKYLDIANVSITAIDSYSREVIDKAIRTATQIQETTKNHLIVPIGTSEDARDIAKYIALGIAFSSSVINTDEIKKWLDTDRAELIATNESNWIYNHEEYEEAKSKYSTKIWHTCLDEKVRLTHMEVEGAEVPIDEVFHVGGSLLRFPGDLQYNPDPSEIINCRCTVEYQ